MRGARRLRRARGRNEPLDVATSRVLDRLLDERGIVQLAVDAVHRLFADRSDFSVSDVFEAERARAPSDLAAVDRNGQKEQRENKDEYLHGLFI